MLGSEKLGSAGGKDGSARAGNAGTGSVTDRVSPGIAGKAKPGSAGGNEGRLSAGSAGIGGIAKLQFDTRLLALRGQSPHRQLGGNLRSGERNNCGGCRRDCSCCDCTKKHLERSQVDLQ